MHQRSLPPDASLAILLLGVALIPAFLWSISPHALNVTYHAADGSAQLVSLPFKQKDQPVGPFRMTMDIAVTPLTARHWGVSTDDCLQAIIVNGEALQDPDLGYCDFDAIRSFDLSPLLKHGLHSVELLSENTGGDVSATVVASRTDPMFLLWLAYVLAIVWFMLRLLFQHLWPESGVMSGLILLWGTFLRISYVLVTPYGLRAHDSDAHVDYIRYVSQHLRVPPGNGGWEYHQAPLYYFLTGLYHRVASGMGAAEALILRQLQVGSLFFSILTLLLGYDVARLTFPGTERRWPVWLMTSVLAVFPSLVFISSRLYNDALYPLLGLAVIALLLRWWQGGSPWTWFGMSVALASAYLTKMSALAFLPAVGLCLLIRHGRQWRAILRDGAVLAVTVTLLAGWLPVLRLAIEPETSRTLSLGNEGMHSGLIVGNQAENLLTFHPLRLLEQPFNNPWDDATRRQYFPEYFYRSAFFGEFGFESVRGLAIAILILSFLLLPFLLWGMLSSLHRRTWRSTFPPLLLLLGMLAANIAYRLRYPYASNQDFRFMVLGTVPLAAFLTLGIQRLPWRLRALPLLLAACLIASCSVFLLQFAWA